jgi:diguanylate cyclase (GGDEF)-like protein/PAS domain S-box-containing protein
MGIIILVFASLSVYLFSGMKNLVENTSNIYNHPLQVTRAILTADADIVRMQLIMNNIDSLIDIDEISFASESIDNYELLVLAQFDIIDNWILGEEGKQLFNSIQETFFNWKSVRDEIILLAKDGDNESAMALNMDKGSQQSNALFQEMELLRDDAANKATEMVSSSIEIETTIISQASSVIVVLLIFSIVFSRHLVKIIYDPITLEREIAKQKIDSLSVAVDGSNSIIFMTDVNGIFTYINSTFTDKYGFTEDEIIGEKTPRIIKSGETKNPEYAEFWQKILKQENFYRNFSNKTKDGKILSVSASISPTKDSNGVFTGFLAIQEDVTEKIAAVEELKRIQIMYQSLVETSQDLIWRIDKKGRFVYVNDAWEALLDIPIIEMIGKPVFDFKPESVIENDQKVFSSVISGKSIKGHETKYLTSSGDEVDLVFTAVPWMDVDGTQIGTQGTAYDITKRKESEKRLNYLASHDLLTGLPNRSLLLDRISHAMGIAKRNNKKLGILFIDLDDFKSVNDIFGHDQGDQLLKKIANSIKSSIRDSDTEARIGGDEFVILVENLNQPSELTKIAESLIKNITTTIAVDEIEVTISASVGISVFPDDSEDSETLIQNADIAMYTVKGQSKNNYQFFSSDMQHQALGNLQIRNQLQKAIPNNEFILHYQPQIDANSGNIKGVEALIRWNHPTKGLLMPADFLDKVEEFGLEITIGNWVIETACKQLKSWIDDGLPPIRMTVNISPSQILKPGLETTVKNILHENNIQPELLELELTENFLFGDLEVALPILEELKDIGVRIAIDDFGTGYSSLSHLSKFQFNTLKIDKHFAQAIDNSQIDLAIISGIVTIADKLNLDIVTEGIETNEQLSHFKDIGCEIFQGFYFHKGLPAKELEAIFRDSILI